MTTELTVLAWAIVLGLAHAMATGLASVLQYGFTYNMGPRDEAKPIGGVGGRVIRAFANYMQTFPFFAAAILMAHLAGRHSAATVIGAHLYLWGRLAYVPLYAAGIPVARTLAFVASMAGIILVLLALI